jgi:glycogen debranching enzyme
MIFTRLTRTVFCPFVLSAFEITFNEEPVSLSAVGTSLQSLCRVERKSTLPFAWKKKRQYAIVEKSRRDGQFVGRPRQIDRASGQRGHGKQRLSHTFKNAPHEYHNGGLWPLVTGFYAASLAKRGKSDLAWRYVAGVHAANRLDKDGRVWSFPEYLHGQKHTPGGTSPMGWSAAAAVIAEQSARGERLFGAAA